MVKPQISVLHLLNSRILEKVCLGITWAGTSFLVCLEKRSQKKEKKSTFPASDLVVFFFILHMFPYLLCGPSLVEKERGTTNLLAEYGLLT